MASFVVQCSLLLVTLMVAFGAGDQAAEANRGTLVRAARSPQQPSPQQQPDFPAFQMPQFGFGNPEIVSQDTQRDKNGFAQTTIYKYPNGVGASSVSTSHSGSPKMSNVSWSTAAVLAVVVMKLLY